MFKDETAHTYINSWVFDETVNENAAWQLVGCNPSGVGKDCGASDVSVSVQADGVSRLDQAEVPRCLSVTSLIVVKVLRQ